MRKTITRKTILLAVLLLIVGIVVAGCGSKQQAYNGYATYNPQGAPQGAQPVPVASGCGVAAPSGANPSVAAPLDSAL